jgi:hypothetical protein
MDVRRGRNYSFNFLFLPMAGGTLLHCTVYLDPTVLSRINIAGLCCVSRGSSVSIVSDYGLDDRAIEVRSPAEAKGFFF